MSYRNSGKESHAALPESILEQRVVEPILEAARENVQRDGSLVPVLFLRFQEAEASIFPVELPDTTEEKYAYFGDLGLAFVSMGKRLEEALFLSETWYLSSDVEPQLHPEVRPSQHPRRREAISLVGRNAERTRFTFVIEPFHREGKQRWVFEKRAVEAYNASVAGGIGPVGLLDALFPRRTPQM